MFKSKGNAMTDTPRIVFLFDVDNTLIDNDRVQAHLKELSFPKIISGRSGDAIRTELAL